MTNDSSHLIKILLIDEICFDSKFKSIDNVSKTIGQVFPNLNNNINMTVKM
mgnify:CR=1 FL=1